MLASIASPIQRRVHWGKGANRSPSQGGRIGRISGTKASGLPSLAHPEFPQVGRRSAEPAALSRRERAPDSPRRPLAEARGPRALVLGLLRARPALGGGLGSPSANRRSDPRGSLHAPPPRPPPQLHLAAPTLLPAENCGRATAEGKPERGHPGLRAAGLRPAGGGHASMAGRRGQGGSLPPQDLLLGSGHPGPSEIHPRCAPSRAPCSPGSQEKFGRGRNKEGLQPAPGPAARDAW